MPPSREDNPGVRIPPPGIFLGFFAIGAILRRFWNIHLPGGRAVALPLCLLAVGIASWAVVVMGRARTGILPHHPATELLRAGPFRFSRNPIYLSMVLGYLGAALWIDVAAALVLLPVAIIVLHYAVIRREEAYLERRFGDAYRQYRREVRRWL